LENSDECKRIRAKPFGGLIFGNDPLHFGINNGEKLKSEHLQALILYTDWTDLCTLFSRSLRKDSTCDSLDEVKKKNSKFFYWSKYLRELITYFGSSGDGLMNKKVKGPFFSGVNCVLNVSEFAIGFNAPTSTSKSFAVARRFADMNGMVITVNNEDTWPSYQPVFDTTWISMFNEEDEYLWFGSVFKLTLTNILRIFDEKGSKKIISAFWYFDAILTETFAEPSPLTKGDVNRWKKYIKQALNWCIRNTLGLDKGMTKPKKVDKYAADNWYCFRQKKTKMVINMRHLMYFEGAPKKNERGDIPKYESKEGHLVNLLFSRVKDYDEHEVEIPNDECNIFKPDLFKLFPNLRTIELKTGARGAFPMNLEKLLDVLKKSKVPIDFQLKIKDHNKLWIRPQNVQDLVNLDPIDLDAMKELYAESKWHLDTVNIEVKEEMADFTGSWYPHWLRIQRM